MIIYNKLAKILKDRDMVWRDLCKSGINRNTPTQFSHNRTVSTDTIDKICEYLNVQPGDIMEWISPEEVEKRKELEDKIAELKKKLKNCNH